MFLDPKRIPVLERQIKNLRPKDFTPSSYKILKAELQRSIDPNIVWKDPYELGRLLPVRRSALHKLEKVKEQWIHDFTRCRVDLTKAGSSKIYLGYARSKMQQLKRSMVFAGHDLRSKWELAPSSTRIFLQSVAKIQDMIRILGGGLSKWILFHASVPGDPSTGKHTASLLVTIQNNSITLTKSAIEVPLLSLEYRTRSAVQSNSGLTNHIAYVANSFAIDPSSAVVTLPDLLPSINNISPAFSNSETLPISDLIYNPLTNSLGTLIGRSRTWVEYDADDLVEYLGYGLYYQNSTYYVKRQSEILYPGNWESTEIELPSSTRTTTSMAVETTTTLTSEVDTSGGGLVATSVQTTTISTPSSTSTATFTSSPSQMIGKQPITFQTEEINDTSISGGTILYAPEWSTWQYLVAPNDGRCPAQYELWKDTRNYRQENVLLRSDSTTASTTKVNVLGKEYTYTTVITSSGIQAVINTLQYFHEVNAFQSCIDSGDDAPDGGQTYPSGLDQTIPTSSSWITESFGGVVDHDVDIKTGNYLLLIQENRSNRQDSNIYRYYTQPEAINIYNELTSSTMTAVYTTTYKLLYRIGSLTAEIDTGVEALITQNYAWSKTGGTTVDSYITSGNTIANPSCQVNDYFMLYSYLVMHENTVLRRVFGIINIADPELPVGYHHQTTITSEESELIDSTFPILGKCAIGIHSSGSEE